VSSLYLSPFVATAALIQRANSSLLTLEAILRTSSFLTSDEPGFVDYVAYGRWVHFSRSLVPPARKQLTLIYSDRYMMMASAVPQLAQEVWKRRPSPEVAQWIARIEQRYAERLKTLLSRLPQA
jgi:glutathione S-transferase